MHLAISYYDLIEMQRQIEKDSFFKKTLEAGRLQTFFSTFLKKSSTSFVWDDGASLWRLIFIIQLTKAKSVEIGCSDVEVVLFADRRPWTGAIRTFLNKYPVEVKYVNRQHICWKFLLNKVLGQSRINYLRALLTDKTIITQAVKVHDSLPPKLVLEYYGLCSLEDKRFYSDFTFMQESTFQSTDIVVVTSITVAPLGDEHFQQFSKRGMDIIALHPQAVTTKEIPVFCQWSIDGTSMTILYPADLNRGLERKWFKKLINDYQMKTTYYENLFRSIHGKLYLT